MKSGFHSAEKPALRGIYSAKVIEECTSSRSFLSSCHSGGLHPTGGLKPLNLTSEPTLLAVIFVLTETVQVSGFQRSLYYITISMHIGVLHYYVSLPNLQNFL